MNPPATLPEAKALVVAWLDETPIGQVAPEPKDSASARSLLSLSREAQVLVLEGALAHRHELREEAVAAGAAYERSRYREERERLYGRYHDLNTRIWGLDGLSTALLRRKLPMTRSAMDALTGWLARDPRLPHHTVAISACIAAAEAFREAGALDDALEKSLRAVLCALKEQAAHPTDWKQVRLLNAVLESARQLPLHRSDVWSLAARGTIEALGPEQQTAWADLLDLCSEATASKPGAAWSRAAWAIVKGRIGADAFRASVIAWFALVDEPRPADLDATRGGMPVHPLVIGDWHANILRGLVWASEPVATPEMNRVLTALALSCYRKVPGIGPRLTKVGNACIATLGAIGGGDAIGQLAILKGRVKFGMAQAALEKVLTATAKKEGCSREELEEMSIPDYGLTGVGTATVRFGEITAEISVPDSRTVSLRWVNPKGRTLKAPPACVKNDFPEELRELRGMRKDISRMLAVQAERIDQLFLLQKRWSFRDWRQRYDEHPLVGVLARRLIWNFHTEGVEGATMPVLRNGERFETVSGEAFEPTDGEAVEVSLWHPMESAPEEILAWRQRLETLETRQPFKQAHREIYLFTPAEETTGVYSNRFASHILRQHQFNALCALRGWKNKLRLMVDDFYPPTRRELPLWNLRAEFRTRGVGDEFGRDSNESAVYHYLTTDQVRFYPMDAPVASAHAFGGEYELPETVEDRPVPLREIPPLVLSEILRDVDLFVGVCSVGNDPNWADGGPQGRHREYWESYNRSELSGSAQTRRDLLLRLVPRLRIAPQCTVSERHLIVRGTVREYRIHLGSGNILMSPDDRYLCIVARRMDEENGTGFFLPFEGDALLSLILSKAFLLAADDRITDPTILAQISR